MRSQRPDNSSMYYDALLADGASTTVFGVTITVVNANDNVDQVQVTVNQ